MLEDLRWHSLSKLTLTSLFVGMCLLSGCRKYDPPKKDELEARLRAALQISSSGDRDSRLKGVATDAADLGVGDIVKQALMKIANPGDRDETAGDCALRLAKVGQGDAATDVAGMIVNPGSRDRMLKKLSERVQ